MSQNATTSFLNAGLFGRREHRHCELGYRNAVKFRILGYMSRPRGMQLKNELQQRRSWGTTEKHSGFVYLADVFFSAMLMPPLAIFIARQHTDARYWYSNSVRPSARDVPGLDENGLTYCHSFFSPHGSPIILVLSASNIFTKFWRGHISAPLRGR